MTNLLRGTVQALLAGCVVYAGFAACGDNGASNVRSIYVEGGTAAVPAAMAQTDEGTRLKTIWLTSPDGFRFPAGIQDTELGIPCGAVDFAGDLLCGPVSGGTVRYTNSTCSQKVVVTTAGQSELVTLTETTRTGFRYTLGRTSGAYTGDIYAIVGDACVESNTTGTVRGFVSEDTSILAHLSRVVGD